MSLRSTLLTFVILHSSFVIHAAPPPELTVLRQQYDKAYAERVTAVFDASKAALDAKFTTALENAIATAKTSGDLPTVLAIQGDKKAIEAKQDLPADTDTTPAALKTLRGIYREHLAKLAEQRTANTAALITPYAAKLQQLEATLTKADRVEEAKEVMDYRVGLKADAPAAPAVTATTAPAPTSSTPATTSSKQTVKGDDRKAADWVLSVGGTVEIWENQFNSRKISTLGDLPPGKLALRRVSLDNNNGSIKPVTDTDLSVLAGLERLEIVQLQSLNITSAAFGVFQTCPQIKQFILQYNSLGDDLWPYLSGLKQLKQLSQGFDKLPVQGLGISKLSSETLNDLFLGNTKIVDAALAEIGTFTEMTRLDLDACKITDAGMPALAPLKKLFHINVRGTNVTATGLASLKSAPLSSLGYGISMADFTEQLPQVAALFPKLERLILPRDVNPTPEEWKKVAQAMPRVTKMSFNSWKFSDSACEGLDLLPELEELDLAYAPLTNAGIVSLARVKKLDWLSIPDAKITDAALETFAGMKKLKALKLPKPANGLTAEGIAKFKKQRPDVKMN